MHSILCNISLPFQRTLIKGYARLGRMKEAFDAVRRLREALGPGGPNEVTYSTLIHACVRHGHGKMRWFRRCGPVLTDATAPLGNAISSNMSLDLISGGRESNSGVGWKGSPGSFGNRVAARAAPLYVVAAESGSSVLIPDKNA